MVGKLLRQARLQRGLTQERVAAKAKLSREYVSMVECGRGEPSVAVLLRLCRAIGVKASEIVAHLEDATPPASRRR
jgi:transcriptional regulator with XRE-family HTH domain